MSNITNVAPLHFGLYLFDDLRGEISLGIFVYNALARCKLTLYVVPLSTDEGVSVGHESGFLI